MKKKIIYAQSAVEMILDHQVMTFKTKDGTETITLNGTYLMAEAEGETCGLYDVYYDMNVNVVLVVDQHKQTNVTEEVTVIPRL